MTKEDIREEFNNKTGYQWNDDLIHYINYTDEYVEWLEDKIIKDDEILNVNIGSLSDVCLENLELRQKIDKLEEKIIQMDKERIKEI
jgi:hypothetical protein